MGQPNIQADGNKKPPNRVGCQAQVAGQTLNSTFGTTTSDLSRRFRLYTLHVRSDNLLCFWKASVEL